MILQTNKINDSGLIRSIDARIWIELTHKVLVQIKQKNIYKQYTNSIVKVGTAKHQNNTYNL